MGGAALIACAIIWQALALHLQSLLLPTFTDTLVSLRHMIATRELWEALWISNQAALLGFSLAAVAGIATGLLSGRWPIVEQVVEPYLSILLATPKAALVPILIMATGLGLLSRVLIVFSFSFVSIAVNTRAGLLLAQRDLVEMARAFGATETQLWKKVLLPGAFPGILVGLRLGVVRAVSGMITAELLLLALGVGRLFLTYEGTFQAANLYSVILVVMAEAVVLTQTLNWVERRAFYRFAQAAVE